MVNKSNFYLDFGGDLYQIDVPVNFDKIKISLKRYGKYAREILIDGEVTFWDRPIEFGHQLSKLLEYHKEYGDEAVVNLIIQTESGREFRWQLDYLDCKTDRESYFTCKLITNSLKKILEDNKSVKVDVFSNLDAFGNNINYIQSKRVKLLPKEIREISTHTTGNSELRVVSEPIIYDVGADAQLMPSFTDFRPGNPWGALGSEDSSARSYYVETDQAYVGGGSNNVYETYKSGGLASVENFWFDVDTQFRLDISDLIVNVNIANAPPNINLRIQMAIITYDNSNRDNVVDSYYVNLYQSNGKVHEVNTSINAFIPAYSRVIYEFRVSSGNGFTRTLTDNVEVIGGLFQATRVGIFEATTAKMARLYHVAERVVNSFGLGEIQFDAECIGRLSGYWNSYVTSGSHIRNLLDQKFNVSLEDIRKFVQNALNGDIQISGNKVFIGNYRDFYADYEVGRIKFEPNVDSYEITLNDDLVKNEFTFEFESYEDEEKDTLDAFHTSSQWWIPKRNEGKIEAKVNFIADGYSIEYARRQGITEEPTTLKDKDDKIYVIDTIEVGKETQNRRSQLYDSVTGIFSPDSVYNLLYSIKRLIIDNYSERLKEINITNKYPFIAKNKEFIANGDLRVVGMGYDYEDDADITNDVLRGNPILDKEIYNFELNKRIDFESIITIFESIIELKGYVTFFDDEKEIKMYPYEMNYDAVKQVLNVKAERKYEV